MGQQSDNNLDALFQKAAEEYPLKTNNKNWDIVAAKLHTSSNVVQTKKGRKWQYSVLLFLLLGGSFFVINSINKKRLITPASKQSSLLEKSDNKSKQQTEAKKANIQHAASTQNSNLVQLTNNTKSENSFEKANRALISNASLDFKIKNKETNGFPYQIEPGTQPKLTAANSAYNGSPLNFQKNNVAPLLKESITQQSSEEITQNAGITNNNADINNRKSKRIHLQSKPTTFYGMFFFSPAFSTIRFQHINKPGYSIGVALGYRINNRISAELGLQRVHANFYSDGKYVETANLKLKPSAKLDELNGNNKLTQVPIALRYNLLKNNNHFFATGGTTIALITHTEKFDYNVIKNGAPRDVYRKFSALTGTKFFSSVNVSIGYQTPVSKFFDVKVEPYFQAATKGLGVGNLPVNNFGLNIGIIKDLK